MDLLSFENVTYTYPQQSEAVLENISFSMKQGEFVVLCGQSGCGKSTLLRHMKKNFITAGKREGKVRFEGCQIEQLDDRTAAEKIGFVGQNPDGQIVTDKVWHELAFGLESLGESYENINRRVAEMAEYFGLGTIFEQKTQCLSGGQKQIVSLASVMVMRPKLLILDEPTSQLDPIAARRFISTIEKLNQDFGITILLSEQRLEEVIPVAGRVLVMHQGRLVGDEAAKKCAPVIRKADSPVYAALPAAMRLFDVTKSQGESPVTTREGVKWLWDSGYAQFIKGEKGTVKKENKEKDAPYVLLAREVAFSYEKKSEKEILKDFTIKVPKGCIYAMLGGNGSGKTTALKVLANIYKPKRGKVKQKGRILYLPQNPQLIFTEPTVCEELEEVFAGHEEQFAGYTQDQCIELIKDMLEWMDLIEKQHSHPYDLSFGQQQRLALAKVLLLKPDILLLDEPTKGLDAAFKEKLAGLLKQLCAQEMTVLLVSHDVDFCAEYADYCSLLFGGVLTERETTEQFFSKNYFYTTPVSRMMQSIDENSTIITVNQALHLLKK